MCFERCLYVCGCVSHVAVCIRCRMMRFAFSSSALRSFVRPFPPRLRKYVNMRSPETGPFGDTFFDARLRAMAAALLVNSPGGGWVESVLTLLTQRFGVFFFGGIVL